MHLSGWPDEKREKFIGLVTIRSKVVSVMEPVFAKCYEAISMSISAKTRESGELARVSSVSAKKV